MATYRSALGRPVDMAALAAKNEKTRAVGNATVNARGDTIDSHNNVVVPATVKVNQAYLNGVDTVSAMEEVIQHTPAPKVPSKRAPPIRKNSKIAPVELTPAERAIEDDEE